MSTLLSICNLLALNFSRGIFADNLNSIDATLYRYDYTLRMIARQGCNYDDPYTPDCVAG
jgi:hypothetical protein